METNTPKKCKVPSNPRPLQILPPGSMQEIEPELKSSGDSFRDRTPTISSTGKRNWIYPRKPEGKFFNYRTYVSYLLLVIFFAVPWIKINGNPFFMFNVIERKFVILGNVFWPQDFYIFAISLLSLAIFAVLFTAVFGRIWCGWLCPQTIFMEHVFRKIEYWIEGNANAQRKLAKQEWDGEKIRKRVMKYSIFYALSFVVGNLLLSYIIGIESLIEIVTSPPTEHLAGFMAMIGFSALFFWIFSWFREQACTFVCPYGRLQSVLLDKNSIIVAYDYKRGDPRGKFKKKRDPDLGDCIDCNKCVQVCPTGIDIRNGTQLECINCTACMDACDSAMTQVGKEPGLIRYTSENNIENGEKFKFTPRLMLYSILLVVLISVVGLLLSLRSDIDATVLRTKGSVAYQVGEDKVMNMLTVNFVNKTNEDKEVELQTENGVGELKLIGYDKVVIPAGKIFKAQYQLTLPKENLKKGANRIEYLVLSDGKVINQVHANFLNR